MKTMLQTAALLLAITALVLIGRENSKWSNVYGLYIDLSRAKCELLSLDQALIKADHKADVEIRFGINQEVGMTCAEFKRRMLAPLE